MHTARRVVAGAGTLMACALITLISMTGNQWVRDHPTGVVRLGVGLLIGAVACFVFWMLTSDSLKKLPPPSLSNSGIQTGRDNSGHSIVAGRDVFVGAPPPPDPAVERLKPNLRAKTPKKVYLNTGTLSFRQLNPPEGKLAMIVPIEHVEADAEGRGCPVARKIAALLRLEQDGEEMGTVAKTYWLDQIENQVNIPIWESRFVIIGFYEPGVWLCYANTTDVAPAKPHTWHQIQNYATRSQTQVEARTPTLVFLTPYINVELRIFSVDTGESLLKKSYRLSIYRNNVEDFIWEELG